MLVHWEYACALGNGALEICLCIGVGNGALRRTTPSSGPSLPTSAGVGEDGPAS